MNSDIENSRAYFLHGLLAYMARAGALSALSEVVSAKTEKDFRLSAHRYAFCIAVEGRMNYSDKHLAWVSTVLCQLWPEQRALGLKNSVADEMAAFGDRIAKKFVEELYGDS